MGDKGEDRHSAVGRKATAGALEFNAAPADAGGSARWRDVGWRVLRSVFEHRLLSTAGGVAFFALMAIFPALATIVSLYGLFADPHSIPDHVALLAGVIPANIIDLLKEQILHLAEMNISTLSTAFLIGILLFSMWSANSGVSALFDALNVVHGEKEGTRGLMRFYATTFAVTLGSVVYGVFALIGILPVAFRYVGLSEHAETLASICVGRRLCSSS